MRRGKKAGPARNICFRKDVGQEDLAQKDRGTPVAESRPTGSPDPRSSHVDGSDHTNPHHQASFLCHVTLKKDKLGLCHPILCYRNAVQVTHSLRNMQDPFRENNKT